MSNVYIYDSTNANINMLTFEHDFWKRKYEALVARCWDYEEKRQDILMDAGLYAQRVRKVIDNAKAAGLDNVQDNAVSVKLWGLEHLWAEFKRIEQMCKLLPKY
jgi:hypothetical protein